MGLNNFQNVVNNTREIKILLLISILIPINNYIVKWRLGVSAAYDCHTVVHIGQSIGHNIIC